MHGLTIISEVLFLVLVISLIFLVYGIASPMIYSMQVSSAFDQSKAIMLKLDSLIQEVASQGTGSKRSIYLTMGAGTMLLDEAAGVLRWSLETDAMLVSPRSMQQIGNLIIGSNLESGAYESTFQGTEAFVLENSNLRAYIRKVGSAQSPQNMTTGSLLLGIYNKKLGRWMPLSGLEISIDQSAESMSGTGYTELPRESRALPRAEALAHINTTYSFMSNYTISFALEAGADFLTVGAESEL